MSRSKESNLCQPPLIENCLMRSFVDKNIGITTYTVHAHHVRLDCFEF